MVKLLERDIEDRVCRYAKTKEWTHRKYTTPARRAAPDRIFLGFPGYVFFIEFKAPGKKATVLQKKEHEALRELGCDCAQGYHLGRPMWAEEVDARLAGVS